MKVTGACHCGAITIEGEADPEKVGICHCTDCQTGTGSAFCGQCGSPIYSTTPGEGQQAAYMVRVGILAQRDQLAPKKQNWFRSARNWVTSLDAVHKNQKQA